MRLNSTGLLVTLFLSQIFIIHTQAQSSAPALAPGYYVVVAAYRLHQDAYAKNYINSISKEGVSAQYGADLGRKYLYVYLDYFQDFDESVKDMLDTRKKAGFGSAWVRIMKDELATDVQMLTQNEPAHAEPAAPLVQVAKTNPTTEKSAEIKNDKVLDSKVANNDSKVVASTTMFVEAKQNEAIETKPEIPAKQVEAPITQPKPVAEATVLLSLFNATNNNLIEGEVEVVDVERTRLINKVKGNELIRLPDPKSKSGEISLIANVFGYRPIQHDIFYGQIPPDSANYFMDWDGNHYNIKFELVRYHKGDINTLYNVFFYNDAAIMLPESKYQLNNLLTMMKENPHYRIMLHGHTNGNSRGRIITMGPSKTFFSLADDVKDGSGSAKELSKQRALVIKDWLASEGIMEDRIEIKAWGGARMIHDKNSQNAKKNVRVDVEILEE